MRPAPPNKGEKGKADRAGRANLQVGATSSAIPLCLRSFFLALALAFAGPAPAAVEVIGVQYKQDNPHTEFNCYWGDRNYPTNCPNRPVAGNLHVFLRNTGPGSASVTDVTMAGHSLKTVLKLKQFSDHYPYSIYYYWDNPPQNIFDVGEPIWFKGDPTPIPVGGVGQAIVRLRRMPVTGTVGVSVVTTVGTVTTNITIDGTVPVLASATFSTNRSTVYLHWRRTGGAAPTTILMNGTNVTAQSTTVGDPAVDFAATVLQLPAPLAAGSYHVFQGVYADGKIAGGGLRVWANPFIYGIWGGKSGADNDYAAARAWVDECLNHGVNAQIMNGSSLVNDLMGTASGRQYCADRGFGFVIDAINQWNVTVPLMWFLDDEPDNEEANLLENTCGTGFQMPCGSNPAGVLGMHFIPQGETLRAASPTSPTTINLNGTYKPYSWQTYGQLADVLMIDSYYDARARDAYWLDNRLIPLYRKPGLIYAVSLAGTTAAEPNPFHMLLGCFQTVTENAWPFADPGSKRVEVYYALAGGAKGMGYWWFNKPRGLDVWTADAHALWKEMGLCGNEIKTVAPWLVNGHPVAMNLTGSTNVWAKSVAVGTNTMILFVVNQDHYNDSSGNFHSTALNNATLTATLPAWMRWPLAFEVAAAGFRAVNTQINGNNLQINLGTLPLTRMIVLTKDPQVAAMVKQRYDQQVRPGLCAMAPELCTNSKPAIVLQPQSQTVLPGTNVTFVVLASGTPNPSYQWRFNGANLPGANSDTYTRANAQAAHDGGYSVVVSNSLGVVTSAVATLIVSTNGIPPSIITPPQSQTVNRGDNAIFTVAANGSQPLGYQWRFNGGNLAGATGTSYTRFNAQTNDTGNYTVVITNGAGALTSAPAALTVSVPILCLPVGLVNGGFEGGNVNGVATGWTGYQRAPNPTTTWSIQTAGPPEPGSTQYQQIANTGTSGGGGGVRQDITGIVPGATYQVSGWMRGNSILYTTCTVKVSPTASTNWATAAHLNPPQSFTGNYWVTFSGSVVASGTSMTLWLDGETLDPGNKAECFDSVSVSCVSPMAPPLLEARQFGASLVFHWPTNHGPYDLMATTNLGPGAMWGAVTPAPTVVVGTNVVTNALSGDQRFYRLKRP